MMLRVSWAVLVIVATVSFIAGGVARAEPPARRSGVLAMPLARRCELARLVAFQVADIITESRRHEQYLAGGRGGLLVWVGEPTSDVVHGAPGADNQKLIRSNEACEPVDFPNGPHSARIDIVGQGLPPDALHRSCLALVARERGRKLALVLEFNRPETCEAPLPQDGGPTMRSGRAMIMATMPQLEIDIDIAPDHFKVERAALTFSKHVSPVP